MQALSPAVYRVSQIREAERVAIEKLHMPGLQLMQSAGLAAFNALRQHWPDEKRITVFCGVGNNAGDGYVVARLALQEGFTVWLYSVASIDDLQGDALMSYQDFLKAGGHAKPFAAKSKVEGIIVDAMLGTGLNRPVSDDYAIAIQFINASKLPVLAVDVPSGLHADSGNVLGCAVRADVTVTFIALKCGLFTGDAANHCGEIACSSLNVPESVLTSLPRAASILTKSPLPSRPRSAHKGYFGHVLLIGGNSGYSGAIRLAGEAALRSGAGLVSIATRAAHSAFLNIGRPELMCHGVEYPAQLQPLLEKANSVVIGPGLGQDDWAQALLSLVMASDRRCVLDADALNLLGQHTSKRDNWVLTPHPGEAARLLDCTTRDIGIDRFAAIKKLQAQYGGICVLKGAGSLIADQHEIFIATTGNPGMATGGMGDVLSGVIGGLLAQNLQAMEAVRLAVYVHGEAADLAATESGERGMLASDLFPKIRELLN
ncbi:MAG: NAD(P)H-hydrate dehydratase [Gammaproteobacteria bacterium]